MGGIGWKMIAAGIVIGLAAGAAGAAEKEGGLYQADGVYQIESFQALQEFSQMVALQDGAFTGEVWLTENIAAEGDMLPIGSPQHMFLGTFDGRGYTISALRMEGAGEFAGLFGYVGNGGSIRNLTVQSAFIMGSRYTGGIAAYNAGTIEKCRLEDSIIAGTGDMEYSSATGGIAGISSGSIRECINQGSFITGRRNVGGVTGSLCAGTIEKCVSTGSVFGLDREQALAGGIAGGIQSGGTMVGCISAGIVRSEEGIWAGGTVGGVLSGEVKRCVSFDEVKGREAGAVALVTVVELCASIVAIIISVPLFNQVLGLITGM